MPPVSQGLSVICRPRGNQAQGKVAGKAEAGSGETVVLAVWGFLTPGLDSWPSSVPSSPLVPKCVFFFFLSIYYLSVPGLSYGTRSL